MTRKFTASAVMNELLLGSPLTRLELATRIGISKQTVGDAIAELGKDGWVVQRGKISGDTGRPASTYAFDEEARFVLGLDLGATRLRIALADFGGNVRAESELMTRDGDGQLIGQMHKAAVALVDSAGISWDRISATAISSPGVINPATGAVEFAPNLPGFYEIEDVLGEFQSRFGHEVVLDNDVNMAAAGEQWLGFGRHLDDFAFLAIGTGVGLGLVIGGELRRGAHGMAGEIGFLPYGADPFDRSSHLRGPLEEAISSDSLTNEYYARTGERIGAPVLFDRAAQGDTTALEVVDIHAQRVAVAASAVTALVDPEMIILGGGIGSQWRFLEPVRTHYSRLSANTALLETSALGSRASLVGAIAAALGHTRRRLFGSRTVMPFQMQAGL